MRRRCYRFRSALFTVGTLATLLAPRAARAQACCAGTTAVTPARLALHEDALVGLQLRAASVIGSFDGNSRYAASPSGDSELDLEQDLMGAVRFLGRGQAAVLVPLVETRRTARALSEFGGGIGDVNLSARYDFTLAGVSRAIPGIAGLAGITFPTGTAPESASTPLSTGATGVGAFQGNIGIAFEQTFGPVTLNLTGIAAKRAARTVTLPSATGGTLSVHEALATQWTALLAGAYSFPNDAAIALVTSVTAEGAPTIDGVEAPDSGRRIVAVSVAGLYPWTDHWKTIGSIFVDPPITPLGRNLPASVGLTATAVYAW